MIVAYLINVYPRPNQSFIRREIAGLEARGIQVHRFALRRCGEAVDNADTTERERTRYVLEGDATRLLFALLGAMLRPTSFWAAFRMAISAGRRSDRGVFRHLLYLAEACVLRGWLREAGVEHLHAHYGTNTATIAMLSRLLGGPPYSFTTHGPEEFDRPQALSLKQKIEHSAFVVAVCEFGRSQLYRWCSHEQWSKINIVRCGVDALFLEPAPSPVPAVPRLLSVGRLAEQKGQLLMVEAAAILAQRGIAFEIVLVGDGEMRGEIEQLIETHSLQLRVKLVGWKSNQDIRNLMLGSRALVMPSFAEGLPVVVMESLALSRPVLSTYIAGLPELVENNVSGFLVPAGSIDALVTAMADVLLADLAHLSRLGGAGAARVRVRHDASMEAARLASFFHESIERENARLHKSSVRPPAETELNAIGG